MLAEVDREESLRTLEIWVPGLRQSIDSLRRGSDATGVAIEETDRVVAVEAAESARDLIFNTLGGADEGIVFEDAGSEGKATASGIGCDRSELFD